MDSRYLSKKIFRLVVFILLVVSLGIYSGNRNSEDVIFRVLDFDQISEPVKVYRDELGIPTIIANEMTDLAFVQGYEFARDRTWQLEQYKAIINGELSRLFGSDLIEVDQFIRTIGFKRAAANAEAKLSSEIRNIVQMYVSGINQFYKEHSFNLPIEYQILGIEPTQWTITDALAMQGVMAFNFAFSGLENELLRQEVINTVGVNKSLELFPVIYQPALEALQNKTKNINLKSIPNPLKTFLQLPNNAPDTASNNWVIDGSKTESGRPIVANDPHLGLEAPGLWYQVNLYITDGSYQAQGFTIPGVPLILIGHNNYVAWGMTSAIIDAVDLFYFKQNETHYYLDGEWKKYELRKEILEVSGDPDQELTIKISDYGPMLNASDNNEYAVRWTLLENYDRDRMFESVYLMNLSKDVLDFHDAIEYFTVPGINIVLADVNGNIAYQYAGLIPIRKSGNGLIPQNGSDPTTGWSGSVNFEDQLFETNPTKGYFVTANNRVDKREKFYISEAYALDYRFSRIKEVLANGTDFEDINPNSITIDNMKNLQADVKNLAVNDLLNPIIDDLKSYIFLTEDDILLKIQNSIDLLDSWDQRMDVDSQAGLIFVTYRIFMINEIFVDELGKEITDKLWYAGVGATARLIQANRTSIWFDDIRTPLINETLVDIAARSLKLTIDYLSKTIGNSMENWRWGNVHSVSFKHVLGDATDFFNRFNVGPEPSPGSTFTVNSYLTAPSIIDGEINYESTYGPSFRLIMQVDESWDEVYGILTPGISGHIASDHYSDGFIRWLNFEYQKWMYDIVKIQNSQEFTAKFT